MGTVRFWGRGRRCGKKLSPIGAATMTAAIAMGLAMTAALGPASEPARENSPAKSILEELVRGADFPAPPFAEKKPATREVAGPGYIAPQTQPATRPVASETRPSAIDASFRLLMAATQPSTRPAVASTQPSTHPALDAQGEAVERHKHMDARWRQIQESQRSAQRTRWTDAKVSRTYKPLALVRLSLGNGLLKVESAGISTASPLRVAVEGSRAIWTLSRPRAPMIGGASGFVSISRFDFDAIDEVPWHTTIVTNNAFVNLFAQSIYENFQYLQNNGQITVRVMESIQWAQAPRVLFSAHAVSLGELRGQHPEEFRMYVMPMLAKFGDTSFLQPGPTDIYSVFTEIPADPRVNQELDLLIPQLDADDPVEREAASNKLHQLGGPGVLAVLRMDESNLSEEQKRRLHGFVSTLRRRPPADPIAERRDIGFLIDCLDLDDPAVRELARTELQTRTGKPVEFDAHLTGDAVNKATDELRKRFLVPPPPAVSPPATNPSPEVSRARNTVGDCEQMAAPQTGGQTEGLKARNTVGDCEGARVADAAAVVGGKSSSARKIAAEI